MKDMWKVAFECGYWGALGAAACFITLRAVVLMTGSMLKKKTEKETEKESTDE